MLGQPHLLTSQVGFFIMYQYSRLRLPPGSGPVLLVPFLCILLVGLGPVSPLFLASRFFVWRVILSLSTPSKSRDSEHNPPKFD